MIYRKPWQTVSLVCHSGALLPHFDNDISFYDSLIAILTVKPAFAWMTPIFCWLKHVQLPILDG
jgi:hypothetical protein